MTKQGIWLLPTKRRIDKLRAFLHACEKTGITTAGLILVQNDELAELMTEYAALPLPAGWAIYGTDADGLADKVRELWPSVKGLDWCGLVCDDLLPQTYLWDQMLVDLCHGKNMVSCDDGEFAPDRVAGAVIWGGELMRAAGYMFPNGFWHTYVDNVWEDLGRLTGCWDVRMDVLIMHDHGFKPEFEQDETHAAAYSRNSADEIAYGEWRLVDFPPTVQRIYAMQGLKMPSALTESERPRGIFDTLRRKFYKPPEASNQKGVTA